MLKELELQWNVAAAVVNVLILSFSFHPTAVQV